MKKAVSCAILLTVAMFLASVLPATAVPSYRYKDLHLGTGYFSSYSFGINASGQVVGDARTQLGDRGFFYDGRTMHLLPTLPAPYNAGGYARGINAAGQVVGYCTNSSGNPRAFVYTPGSGMQDLGLLFDSSSTATCINDAGQVAGYYQTSEPISQTRAFVYTPGVGLTYLSTLPGGISNEARAINNAGQVAGLSDSSTTPYNHRDHAFLYTPGVGVQDLGFLPGSQTEISWANGLNNLGQVVGRSTTENLWIDHPVLWSGGIHDLGALDPESGGEANAINNAGQVVGGASLPFLYSGGHMYSLNSLVQNLPEGIYLTGASGINDRGQIAATSLDSHAYLLTPCLAQPALDLLLLD